MFEKCVINALMYNHVNCTKLGRYKFCTENYLIRNAAFIAAFKIICWSPAVIKIILDIYVIMTYA